MSYYHFVVADDSMLSNQKQQRGLWKVLFFGGQWVYLGMFKMFEEIWLWVKKRYQKKLLIEGKKDQNLWFVGVVFLTHGHFSMVLHGL